jgi:two-component system, LytTR family, sensor kinase
MQTRPTSSRRSRPWALFTAVLVLGWLVVGVIDSLVNAAMIVLLGGRVELLAAARGYARFWGAHALLTPVAVWALRRVPFERGRVWRATGWFVCVLLGYLAIHLTQYAAWLAGRSSAGVAIDLVTLLRGNPSLYYETLGVVFVFLATVGAVNGWEYYLRYREREGAAAALELDRATLRAQLSESRLELLQARLQPHFLFNALHATGCRHLSLSADVPR